MVERYERIASTAESALQPENLIAGDDIAIVDSSGNKVFSVKPNTFLRLSGGIVSGNIFGNSVDFTLGKANAAGRTIIRGGTTYNDGATLYLYGKDDLCRIESDNPIIQILREIGRAHV